MILASGLQPYTHYRVEFMARADNSLLWSDPVVVDLWTKPSGTLPLSILNSQPHLPISSWSLWFYSVCQRT